MRRVAASAPGKVVLSGEYAVLDGAPAVAMAVNRRASVTVDAAVPAAVASPGLSGEKDTRLLDCVCEVLDIARPAAGIVLDTQPFSDTASGKKLGIGSSAALAVALVCALSPDDADLPRVFAAALSAHRNFQDGRGSGVDVAASTAGGLVEYRAGLAPRSLSWPRELNYALLWSGVASSTLSKLAAYGREATASSTNELRAVSIDLADRWQRGDVRRLLDGYRDYVETLQAFDVDHALGIFDAGHDALARYTTPDDTVYKPCGAGGGDVGIVLGADPDCVARFVRHAESRGFRRLDLAIDMLGAEVSRANV